MIGSRVSSRIAQRLIKREQIDVSDDHNSAGSIGGAHDRPLERNSSAVDSAHHSSALMSPVMTRADGLGAEVDSARNKLDDLLAHISKGDSQEEDDFDDDDMETDSSPHMKRRRSQKHKKAGKGAKEDGFAKQSSFVLKLFDRSVDLAQFSHSTARDDAPLYPVCRSWIRNNTQLPNLYESPAALEDYHNNDDLETSGGPIDEKPSGIYHLPKPLPKPKDELGNEIDLRIPESVRNYQRRESQADVLINSLEGDNFSALLARNVSHWKQVRQDWHQSSIENELRYKHSCDVLKAMFDKTLNGQTDQYKPQTMDSIL
ncbi:unnamed protein product [Oppiella nova]|uniref:Uncharacterized protein n=1 Tax=Oppiella nova TaxID=334625 RepID=A0A7R9M1U2_9ACAR|nr:unnamed protein product [Oppiella nova]CAG2169140.1 unnamed protein product [Oppiella nova]